MSKQHVVTLHTPERATLERKIAAGRASARRLTRARILLKADNGPDGPGWTDRAIADALDVIR